MLRLTGGAAGLARAAASEPAPAEPGTSGRRSGSLRRGAGRNHSPRGGTAGGRPGGAGRTGPPPTQVGARRAPEERRAAPAQRGRRRRRRGPALPSRRSPPPPPQSRWERPALSPCPRTRAEDLATARAAPRQPGGRREARSPRSGVRPPPFGPSEPRPPAAAGRGEPGPGSG